MKNDIGAYVSKILRERRKYLELSRPKLANRLADKIGLSSATIPELIRQYEKGNLYGTTSKIGTESNGGIHLIRLGAYIEALGFGVNELHELNKRLKEFDTRYQYPPELHKLAIIK